MEEIIETNENLEKNQESVDSKEKEYYALSIKKQFSTRKGRTRFITRVAMFAALSYVFYAFIKFPLPFFPPFLEVKFHNLFIILSGLLTGPLGGAMTVVAMIGLKLITINTNTAFVGELTDLIISISVMLPASLIYLKKHTKMGGVVGILFSFLAWIVSSFLVNWFISLPFYLKAYFDGNVETFINVLSAYIKNITTDNYTMYYLVFAVLPFNALVAFVNVSVCILVYKRISIALKKIGI